MPTCDYCDRQFDGQTHRATTMDGVYCSEYHLNQALRDNDIKP